MPSSRTKGTSKTILIALVARFVIISSSSVRYSGVTRRRQSLPGGANSFNLRRIRFAAKHASTAPVHH